YRPANPCVRSCRWKLSILASSACGSSVAGNSSSQIASSFNRRRPSIHCSGTEKFPPPSRYFAANPHPRKIVTRAESSFCSRAQARRTQILEDPRQTSSGCKHLGLPCLAGAKSAVRDRGNRAEELRLLPHI